MHHLLRALFALVRLVTGGRITASRQRPMEGNAATMDLREMLWWAYKFYGKPITQPQKGQGIQEHFFANRLEGFAAKAESTPTAAQTEGATSAASVTGLLAASRPSLTIALAGDILPSSNMSAATAEHLFDDITDFYLGASLRYANLESPVVATLPVCWPDENITSPPHMNNSEEAFDALYRNGEGINVFSTANNHAFDQGEAGLLTTLDFLDQRKATHVGTARSPEEQDSFPLIEVSETDGLRAAWLSWTFSLNSERIPEGKDYLVNHLRLNVPGCDVSPIEQQITYARQQLGAHVVVLCLHWGLEYESFPQAHLIKLGHQLIEAGADIIAGNHPHGLQPTERYTYTTATGEQRSGLISYALGDLVSDTPQVAYSALTAVVRVELTRNPEGIGATITQAELKPLYGYRRYDEQGVCTELRLLDFHKLQQRIAAGEVTSEPALNPEQISEITRLGSVLDLVHSNTL